MDTMNPTPFGEVLTAVVTPFDDDGAVDYGTFWRLTRYLIDHGSDGIVVAGTTGESPTLSKVEKIALFKAAVDAIGDRASVIAGAGTYDTRESIELAGRAAEVGCDGVMAVTPYYSRPPQEGLYRHFSAIADASELPVLLYNIPSRTARLIEVETLARLATHDRIVAVKDAVDDIEFTERSLAELPGDFAVYSGSDSMTRAICEAGGAGVVSVAAHLAGPQVKRLTHAAKSGETGEAAKLHDALMPLFDALFVEPSPMPLKAGLEVLWSPVGEPRLPLVAAAPETTRLIEDAMEAAEAV
ncbi:MAG: 4-hydroxy-tetrahydrodipicolinate synthase [Acidimicrobiia bacterium]